MLVIDTSFPSKDFNQRNGETVRQLILHYTAAPFGSSLRTLTRDGVSAHYLVPDLDEPSYRAAGYEELRAFRLVDEGQRAWHAGVSMYQGRERCNDFSIGIEMEGTDTTPYTDSQYQRLAAVTRTLIGLYPAIADNITGHSDIAPERKTDPGPAFDWPRFRAMLTASSE